jgi:hypothetical protein
MPNGGGVNYSDFMRAKSELAAPAGIEGAELNSALFGFQHDLVSWALRRGRACIFADTGLGKTLMQCEWARVVAERSGSVLILAPLAVAEQTVREAARFGIEVTYSRDGRKGDITIANYEMLSHFDPAEFSGVVLDESSILKAYDGKTRNAIIGAFKRTPFRLACTATPSPNDHTELGNHSEFIGNKTRVEMLSEFFVHDGGDTAKWRLKGHARDIFWEWVTTWAAIVRLPSDLGYDDGGFDLQPLVREKIAIQTSLEDAWAAGSLLPVAASSLSEQRGARKSTIDQRVKAIADAIAAEPDEPAIVWCELNIESEMVAKAIPGAAEVKGADDSATKTSRLLGFSESDPRVLVTKPSIAGFGMNWQHCARVYFVGPSNSYEQTYQAIRRCWRFGQTRPVVVRTCVADTEVRVLANVERKAADAETMKTSMLRHVSRASYASEDAARKRWNDYTPDESMRRPTWLTA